MNDHFTNSLIKVTYHPWLVLLQRCAEGFVFADASIHYPLLPKIAKLLFPKFFEGLLKDIKSLQTYVLALVGR